MGYAAARGGHDAIVAAERLIERTRREAPSPPLTDDQLVDRMRSAVDRVMGEGGLWDPALAAAALRQAEGDTIEAAHLLRSHRSTLPRLAYALPVDADELEVLRRIVPAFQQPPGPQLLGRTSDYTGRLLDADKITTAPVEPIDAGGSDADDRDPNGPNILPLDDVDRRPRRLLDLLRDL
ncbi:MAG: carbon-phosphorus lyase complex subunit PhnI, partial [Acidimicrobiales bacterium]